MCGDRHPNPFRSSDCKFVWQSAWSRGVKTTLIVMSYERSGLNVFRCNLCNVEGTQTSDSDGNSQWDLRLIKNGEWDLKSWPMGCEVKREKRGTNKRTVWPRRQIKYKSQRVLHICVQNIGVYMKYIKTEGRTISSGYESVPNLEFDPQCRLLPCQHPWPKWLPPICSPNSNVITVRYQ